MAAVDAHTMVSPTPTLNRSQCRERGSSSVRWTHESFTGAHIPVHATEYAPRGIMRERSGRVLIAIKQNPRILERFWSRVEKTETDNGCWEWKGRCSPSVYPAFQVGQCSIAPCHIIWFSLTGELPL